MSYLKLLLPVLAVSVLFSCNEAGIGDPVHNVNIGYPAAYIVNGGSNNLAVIRLSDLVFTEAIDLDDAPFPHHIYLHPDKNTLAVAITGLDLTGGHGGHGGGGAPVEGQRVQIIDAVSGHIHHELPMDQLPHNAIFSPDGAELWVPQGDSVSGVIQVYDAETWILKQEIEVGHGPSEVTFSHDGMRVFVANTEEGTVSMIDPSTKWVLMTIPTGADPVGAWPASNGRMYVDNEGDRTITEIDALTGAITGTINLGFVPGFAAYHPLYEELWVSDATNGRVSWFKFENGVWTQKGNITTGADTHAIAFTSNGSRAFVTNQGSDTVSIIDVLSHEVIKTIYVGDAPNGVAIRE